MPTVNLPNSEIRQCARCFAPAKTRCSQCKTVWYCCGRCQIVHWRQVHKFECVQFARDFQTASSMPKSYGASSEMPSNSRAANRAGFMLYEEVSTNNLSCPTYSESLDEDILKHGGFIHLQPPPNIPHRAINEGGHLRGPLHGSGIMNGESSNPFQDGNLSSPYTARGGASARGVQMEKLKGKAQYFSSDSCKPPNLKARTSKELSPSETNVNFQAASKSGVARINDGMDNPEVMRTAGLERSEKPQSQKQPVDSSNRHTKIKTIFPYAEFVKFFQFEAHGLAPRGLVNCGNSCYANSVLQCLMCTKPFVTYLLCQSHSRAGCVKDWCLMCELEQLVLLLRESGGPLSPINILTHIRSINPQIGDGSPGDAHEFLRLLVASMQAICLERFGGENAVDPRLQDTTFIQHAFGGRLRSKVTCLRCKHESDRDERMMDLTLEIHGQVESIEDALTHFTSAEDLDGDNMYRCPRCTTYARARKQLKIQAAPNVLTIVLKRFREGSYGKIDKYISFPEMLDMVPFMTGTEDIPPLYLLYAIVVHLDTPQASGSGHYISYVKDHEGHWLRVDDTEVQPVDLSQVLSEEAYILFYMRSHPRATKGNTKATRHPATHIPNPRQHSPSTSQQPSTAQQN